MIFWCLDSGIGVTSSPPPPNTDPILPPCPVMSTETAKLITSPNSSLKLNKEDAKPNPENLANSPAKTTFTDDNRKWPVLEWNKPLNNDILCYVGFFCNISIQKMNNFFPVLLWKILISVGLELAILYNYRS